jgi:hypothetical protein
MYGWFWVVRGLGRSQKNVTFSLNAGFRVLIHIMWINIF